MKKVLAAVPACAALFLAAIAVFPPSPACGQATSPAPAAASSTAPSTPDARINGKWHFVFDTAGGDREFNVDADGKVTGTWVDAPATGTCKDGHLQMAFDTYSAEVGATAQLTLDGKIDDTGTISGTWTFASYDGTFKATHPKP